MEQTTIRSIFAVRDFIRTADDGSQTLVRLIISNPERCYIPEIFGTHEWWRVSWQIQGLQPEKDHKTHTPVSTHGIVTRFAENFDPLSAMLTALYKIRAYLESTVEGVTGKLKWKDVPEDSSWGLPAYQPPKLPAYNYELPTKKKGVSE